MSGASALELISFCLLPAPPPPGLLHMDLATLGTVTAGNLRSDRVTASVRQAWGPPGSAGHHRDGAGPLPPYLVAQSS